MKKENSPCVECVDRGASSADRDWEMSGSKLGLVFAWCVDRSVWLSVWIGASQALCASERAASSACERGVENVWSENLGWNDFLLVLPYFTVKLKIFSVWPNLPSQPNMLFSGKWFPNFVWSQNKRTLSHWWVEIPTKYSFCGRFSCLPWVPPWCMVIKAQELDFIPLRVLKLNPLLAQ